jgi:hypothetical protein
MEAKSPSDPSLGLAQRKQKSDPLGRILECLGLYKHPILYAPFSNHRYSLLIRTVKVHALCFRMSLSIYICLWSIL